MMFRFDPVSQIPPRIKLSAGFCLHTPRTRSSPPIWPLRLYSPPLPTSSQDVLCGHTKNQATPFGERAPTVRSPGALGQGWGQQGWQELASLPLPYLPAHLPCLQGQPGAPLSGGVDEERAAYLLGRQLWPEAPTQLETAVGGEGGEGRGEEGRGEGRRDGHHGALESGQGGQMPDAGH